MVQKTLVLQFGKYIYVVNSAISKRGLDQIMTEYYVAMK